MVHKLPFASFRHNPAQSYVDSSAYTKKGRISFMLKRLAAVLFFSLLAFGSVATALAQSTTASISGTVTDER
jgi:hypothetical protein